MTALVARRNASSLWARLALLPALAVLVACSSAPAPRVPSPGAPARSVPSAVPVSPPMPVPPQPMSLESLTTHLVEAAARHDFAAATQNFGPTMKAALPVQKFAADWGALEQQWGGYQALEKVQVGLEKRLRVAVASTRFERGPLTVKVVFDDESQVAGLWFEPVWQAPSYADPTKFEERPTSVGVEPALPGFLSMPKSEAPVPAVVLVHGSGPSDEDETVGGVKLFKDLAWGLASRGIAVLRYVKRSRQAPLGIVTQKEEVLDAAHAAIELLRNTPGVDAKRIFVIGHSQGGALAPRIAQQNAPLAGIVVLAGPTLSLQNSLLAQFRYLSSLADRSPALPALIEAAERLKQQVEDPKLSADQTIPLPTGGTVKGAYFLEQRGYDAPRVARALPCAVLVLHGDRDYQVSNAEFLTWAQALANRKGKLAKSYPSLNHLFVSGSGPSTPSEYQALAHADETVVNDIARWIQGELAPSAH